MPSEQRSNGSEGGRQLGRIFQIEGTQAQSTETGMRLAYSEESRDPCGRIGVDRGGDGGDTITLTQGPPTYSLFSLYNPPGGEQVCLVEVGGKNGERGSDSQILSACYVSGTVLASGFLFLFCFVLAVTCGILVPQPGIKLTSSCCGSADSYPLDHQGSSHF